MTGQALDVGVSPVGPTPAAVIHGSGVGDQIPQTRVPPILAPTGVNHSTSLILRVTIKAGVNQLRTTKGFRTGVNPVLNPVILLTSGERALTQVHPEVDKAQTGPQAGWVVPFPLLVQKKK